MKERRSNLLIALIVLAVTAAVVRLIPLFWLHPVGWDELEFYRATKWVSQGLLPFRDFWEHHTPLQWFVFAPVAKLIDSPGVAAIIAMRVAQIPLWIGTFAMVLALLRRSGTAAFARWGSLAIALSSGFLMAAAIEYRIDALGCFLYVAGLLLAVPRDDEESSRARMLLSGAVFCLAGLANVRLGPLLAMTVLLLRFVDFRAQAWRNRTRVNWLIGGVLAMLAVAFIFFSATGSAAQLFQHVGRDNWLGDRLAQRTGGQFLHRLLVPFGVRIMGSDRVFDFGGVDPGGMLILLLGVAGLVLALRRWRKPDVLFAVAILQIVNLAFIAKMKFIYNYHFEIVVILMIPLVALALEWLPRRELVLALVLVAWCGNVFSSVFRGKELDLAYQDLVMRTVDERTPPTATVWDSGGWALRREPAYSVWFLPDLARQLVPRGMLPRYTPEQFLQAPPAAVIADHNVLVWMWGFRDLGAVVTKHYVPLWRNLWIPGLSGLVTPDARQLEWVVPVDGDYRLFASAALANHRWFRQPLFVGSYDRPEAKRFELRLGAPADQPDLQWTVDGVESATKGGVVRLRAGQRLMARYFGSEALGILLMPGDDQLLFQQPPEGVTLEGSAPRETHVPRFSF